MSVCAGEWDFCWECDSSLCACEQSLCVCMCAWFSIRTCVCVSVSFSWGLWSRRLPQPGVTFSREGVAYDTSSGLGQTSPDPSSNTLAWSLPSPVFPFCVPTATATTTAPAPASAPATFLPPLPFSLHWTFSRPTPPYSLLHVSWPQQQLGSTCSWSALLLCLAVAGCCSWVTGDRRQLRWLKTVVTQAKCSF